MGEEAWYFFTTLKLKGDQKHFTNRAVDTGEGRWNQLSGATASRALQLTSATARVSAGAAMTGELCDGWQGPYAAEKAKAPAEAEDVSAVAGSLQKSDAELINSSRQENGRVHPRG